MAIREKYKLFIKTQIGSKLLPIYKSQVSENKQNLMFNLYINKWTAIDS